MQPQENGISDVQLSNVPLEQRWRYIEQDLIDCGLSDKALDQYFSDYYTALYYMLEDQSAAAQFFRAIYDLSKPILDKRPEGCQGCPLFIFMMVTFLARGQGGHQFADVARYMRKHAATLQVMLPSFPHYSKLFSPKFFARVMDLISESEGKYMLSGMSKSVFDLLLHTEYRAHGFNKNQAKDRFFENYNLIDAMGSLAVVQVDIKELLRRYSRFLGRSAPEEEEPEVADGETEVENVSLEQNLPKEAFADTLLDMLDMQLKNANLPTLTEAQRQLTFFYAMFEICAWDGPIMCENTKELALAQEEAAKFDYLKQLDPKMFESAEQFDPSLLLQYRDPHLLFGNCIYDKLNDFIMPLVFDEEHPAYDDEYEIRQAMEAAIEHNKPCVRMDYRFPQPDQDTYEQYSFYLYSLEDLNLQNLEYHGKIPFQGWQSVLCVRKSTVSKTEVKGAFAQTAERFKEVRAKFFEEHAAELQSDMDGDDEPIDVVSVLNENHLDNYSLGIMLAPRGCMPGYVRTSVLDPESPEGFKYLNGEHVIVPEGVCDHKGTSYYLLSMKPSFSTLLELLSLTGNEEMFNKFFAHCNANLMAEMKESCANKDFHEFDFLKNTMQSQLRILHSKQVSSGSLLPVRNIRDMFINDVYYLLDGFVLLAVVFDFIVSNRRRD